MSSTSPSSENLDSIRILKLVVKRKKQLIYTGIGALVFSILFTMPQIMKPMYKASATVYPVNIQPYSKETATEQLVQLLNSEDVWFQLVDSFNLFKHYGIDTASAYPHFVMLKELNENLHVNKTEYESVEITAYDENPKLAAQLCNGLLELTDRKAINLIHTRAAEQAVIYKAMMDQKKHILDSLEASIYNIRTLYGITDFEQQVQGFSREYYHSVGAGGANSKMETDRKNLESKGGDYVTAREFLWKVRGQYADYKSQYEQTQIDIKKELSFHNTITKAVTPERKDSPKRTLIIFLFTLSMLFVGVLVIIFQEHYGKVLQARLTDEN